MKLLVATRSKGKQREFAELLRILNVQVVVPDDVGLSASPAEAGLESFETFEENAAAKAWWFAEQTGLMSLADDSGLEVDALRGAPGVHSKRFAGIDGSDEDVSAGNNQALLRAMAGITDADRTARYRCVLVLARPLGVASSPWSLPPEGKACVAQGVTEGRILRAPLGRGGFGYDPLFFSTEIGRAFGEVDAAAKHRVSHRGRAVATLIATLMDSIGSVSVN